MTLTTGDRLGPYEIDSSIGAGGMGEVYLANDTRLERQVAIKILTEGLAGAGERRQRFEREAKVISTLSHPNICSLYDIGDHDGQLYLVMEYLEGETLSDRLEKGAMPTSQVLRYGAEIAAALSQAHRQGVVHRDLKPGNVILTSSGAKLLDFGLAKSAGEGDNAPDPMMSAGPTQQQPLTEEGTLLGTYPYMAPEQVEGREADARSDIFALGAVLYEMVTGKRAFEGSSRASLLAAILERDPPTVSSVQEGYVPPALDYVIQTCLAKDPEDRWQDARDVASQLRWISQGSSQTEIGAPASRRKRRRWPLLAAVLGVALAASLIGWMARVPSSPTPISGSLSLPIERNNFFSRSITLSPDGSRLAFVAWETGNEPKLWVRSLESAEVRSLAGTEGATYPFWSPDSRHIAFFTPEELRKIDLESGTILTICDAADSRGGTWSRTGEIVMAPRPQGGLFRVDAMGGEPKPFTRTSGAESTGHRWPRFVDGDERVIFYLFRDPEYPDGVYVADLDTGEYRLVAEENSEAWVVGDRLLYYREGNVFARNLDMQRFEVQGPPIPVARNVSFSDARWKPHLAAGERLLIFYENNPPISQLAWIARDGKVLARVGEPGHQGAYELSPDGSLAAMISFEGDESITELIDTTTGVRRPLTLRTNIDSLVWSSDGQRIAFTIREDEQFHLYVTSTYGAGEETLIFSSPYYIWPTDWTPADDAVILTLQEPESGNDLALLPVEEGAVARPLIVTDKEESSARVSPDGRWMSYISDESGKLELYVASFPEADRKWQVSSEGALSWGLWSSSGAEILYGRAAGGGYEVFTVPFREERGGLVFDPHRPYFGDRDLSDIYFFDIDATFDRALVLMSQDMTSNVDLKMLIDWQSRLEE